MEMLNTFHKSEKLNNKKLISKLFEKGNRGFSRFPFRFSYFQAHFDSVYPIQVLFVVSKRNYPKATDRNKIKRQTRELYRLAKNLLYDEFSGNKQMALAIQFYAPSTNVFSYAQLENIFDKCINQLKNELEKMD